MAELVGSQTPAMAAMRRVQKIVKLAAVKRRSQAGCMLFALFLTTQAKPTFHLPIIMSCCVPMVYPSAIFWHGASMESNLPRNQIDSGLDNLE